ncbi:MAG: hypothetical protein AABY18_03195 [Candidatus Thermoplasmatota archaeon]
MLRLRLMAFALVAFLVAGAVAPAPAKEWAILMAPAEAPPQHLWSPEEWAARADAPPLPGIQDGLGTGSAMHQVTGGSGFICTAAFLLRDPTTGIYYLATAGHCLVRDENDPAGYTGAANPEKMHTEIDVCIAGCISNALGLGEYVALKPRDGIHPVTFARSGGVGRDFGIVQLPPEVHDDLRPHMPQWGGPTGTNAGGVGDVLLQYGHGSYCCPAVGAVATRTPVDQGRAAVSLGADASSFSAVGHVTGGDSGSGIVRGTVGSVDVITGAEAVGVITHGLAYVGAEFSGTVLAKGLAMVRDATGLNLELVLAGDPLPRGPTAAPEPPVNLTVTSPQNGATLDLSAKKVTVQGTAVKGDEPLPEGSTVQVAIDDMAYGIDSRLPVQGNASWKATWDFAGEKAGQHTIRTRIVDADGAVLDQSNVTVSLKKGGTSASASGSAAPSGAPPSTAPGGKDAGGENAGNAVGIGGPAGLPAPSTALVAVAVAGLAALARRRQ